MASSDLDAIIDAAAASSRSRFPASGNPIDKIVQNAFARQTRDRDAADKIQRNQQGPMRYLDDSQPSPVVVPRGVRKPNGGKR